MNLKSLAEQLIRSMASALGWRAANMLPPALVWVALAIAIGIVLFG